MKSLEELERKLDDYESRVEDEAGLDKKDWQFIFIARTLIEILRELRDK